MKMLKMLQVSLTCTVLAGLFLAFQAHSQGADDYEISQAELDQILAPIALYPDTILSHVLIASTYPLEVIQAERWARENSSLDAEDALRAVERKDWDPSVKALVPFPQILERMSENLDWMQKLGDAFLQNEELVLASVQELRRRAWEEGNLEDLEHLEVSHEEDDIFIEPAVREVVYVPYYDTRVVYGSWWWVDYPPIYWTHHRHHFHSGVHFYWGPRIHVGHSIYFSGVHWHNHHLVVVDRRYARRHHFHTGRQVVRHRDSRKWIHNTRHRRGVEYRHPRLRETHRPAVASRHRDHNARDLSQRLRHPTSRNGVREDHHSRDLNARVSRQQRTTETRATIQRGGNRGELSNAAPNTNNARNTPNNTRLDHPRLNNEAKARGNREYRERKNATNRHEVKQRSQTTTRDTTRSVRSERSSSNKSYRAPSRSQRASSTNRQSRSDSRSSRASRSNSRHDRR